MIWQLCLYFIRFNTLCSGTFWTKIQKKTVIVICTTQIWSRICKLEDFFKVCWQWGSSFCLIFKLFITCQPKKCVTELKVIWNEVMYKNSDSTATLLTNDSLIEGCLWQTGAETDCISHKITVVQMWKIYSENCIVASKTKNECKLSNKM